MSTNRKIEVFSAGCAVCEETIAKWHGHEGLISIFPASSNPTRCSDDLLVKSHDIAEKHDLGVHTHLQETKIQIRDPKSRARGGFHPANGRPQPVFLARPQIDRR